MISGGTDSRARIFAVDDMKLLHTLAGHKKTLYASAFGPAGKRAATACAAGTVRIWDVTSGESLQSFEANGRINGLAFSPDGTLLFGAGPSGLYVWDADKGTLLQGFVDKPAGKVYMMHMHPDGHLLATSTPAGLRLYDLKTRRLVRTIPTPLGPTEERRLLPVCLHPTRPLVASASAGGKIFVWNRETGQLLQTVQAHKGGVFALVFNVKGTVLASGGADMKIHLFDLQQRRGQKVGERSR